MISVGKIFWVNLLCLKCEFSNILTQRLSIGPLGLLWGSKIKLSHCLGNERGLLIGFRL